MKKEIDIRKSVMLTQKPNSGMETLYKRGLIYKYFVITELPDHSTPYCYEPKEEE